MHYNLFSKEYHFKEMKLTLVFFASLLFSKHNKEVEIKFFYPRTL